MTSTERVSILNAETDAALSLPVGALPQFHAFLVGSLLVILDGADEHVRAQALTAVERARLWAVR